MMMRTALAVCVLVLSHTLFVQGITTSTTYSYTGTIQQAVIPPNSRVTMTVAGGGGGQSYFSGYYYNGGTAIQYTGLTFNVVNGANLNIIVGQAGGTCPSGNYCGAGGGGGSFVYTGLNDLWVAAGGGGGAASGGGTAASIGTSGNGDCSGNAAAGSNGADGQNQNNAGFYAKGWTSVFANPSPTSALYWSQQIGGYGGGASGNYRVGGGGGGYSGGGGPWSGSTSSGYCGGGGGSFLNTTLLVDGSYSYGTWGASTNGQVTMTVVTCNPVGSTGMVGPTGVCICNSMYTGAQCDTLTNVATTGCTYSTPTKTVVMPAPTIQQISFTSNTMVFTLQNPYVMRRGYSSVIFANSTNTTQCAMYPVPTSSVPTSSVLSSYWTRSTNTTSCMDLLTVNMPWTAHQMCGFSNTSDINSWTFYGKVIVTYDEFLGNFSSAVTAAKYVNVYRRGVHQYSITVIFPRLLVVSVTQLNVVSDLTIDMSMTKDVYDSNLGQLNLEFTSGLFANLLLPNASIGIPSNTYLSQNLTFDNSGCQAVIGVTCVQRLSFAVMLLNASACTFDGTYTISATATSCLNDTTNACPQSPVSASFVLQTGSVCAQIGVNLQISGTLAAYANSNWGATKTAYTLGDQVFFLVNPAGGAGNTLSIRFVDIYFTDTTGDQYLLLAGARQYAADVVSLTTVPSGKYFSLFLYGQVFRQQLGRLASYSFTVRTEIIFNGNVKRMVESVYEIEDFEQFNEDGTKQQQASTLITIQSPKVVAENAKHKVHHHVSVSEEQEQEEIYEEEEASMNRLKNLVIFGGLFAGVLIVIIANVVYLMVRKQQPTPTAAPTAVTVN